MCCPLQQIRFSYLISCAFHVCTYRQVSLSGLLINEITYFIFWVLSLLNQCAEQSTLVIEFVASEVGYFLEIDC